MGPSNSFARKPYFEMFFPKQLKKDILPFINRNENLKYLKSRKAYEGQVLSDLKPLFQVAQVIMLIPLYGISEENIDKLEFRWRSQKVVCSVFMIVCGLVHTLAVTIVIFTDGQFESVGDIVFYLQNTVSAAFFLHFATKWKQLAVEWISVQKLMQDLPPIFIKKKILTLIFSFVIFAMVEHLLSLAQIYNRRHPCSGDDLKSFLFNILKYQFTFFEFRLWKAVFLYANHLLITLIWTFGDMFIAVISLALAKLLQQLNNDLESASASDTSMHYWMKRRMMYNKISLLVKQMDRQISFIILVSFGANLYFICVQLIRSIWISSLLDAIYLFCSFGLVTFRMSVVCLSASLINEQSKRPLFYMFAVPSEHFNYLEIQRLFMQISSEPLALTGCNIFSITRTFMLTIAGSIITYIVMLVQFNALERTTQRRAFDFLECPFVMKL